MEEANDKKPRSSLQGKIALTAAVMVLLAGFGVAVYTVYSSINSAITIDEAFSLYYEIPSDSANPCSGETGYATLSGDVDMGNFYPGETKKLCVKVVNASSASLPYALIAVGNGDLAIVTADSSPVAGTSTSYAATLVTANDDSAPGLKTVSVSVTRG